MPECILVSKVLGIIGGGQLALYVCEAAQGLGFEVAVLADSADAPALRRADRSFTANTDNRAELASFLACCDIITFDKEAVADDLLTLLLEESQSKRLAVRPGVTTIRLLKDKALQKTWLCEQGLPTLPFRVIAGRPHSLRSLTEVLGHSLVQKRRSGGYDGRGVQILKAVESPESLWDVPSIVEPYLPGCQEISIITARALSGEMQTYPPVSMDFDAQLNAVRTVFMPADISPLLGATAIAVAERAVTLLQGIGVFAIEMFVTPKGELLINEISPRVHNSGHLTQDACNVSQFEQHVRAVLGLPLTAIIHESPAAMCNILYTQDMHGCSPATPVTQRLANVGATVYWYGKTVGATGRKMGHINAVAPAVSAAVATAQQVLAHVTSPHSEHIV